MMISGIKKKKAKGFTFLSGSKTIPYMKVPETGIKIMDALEKLVAGKDAQTGPDIWCYRAAGPGKLVLSAGMQVKPGTRGKAPYTARKVPEWNCLSAVYKGSMPRIIEAWHELMEHAEAKGIACSDERREIYQKWVDMDSRENVTELQIRLES